MGIISSTCNISRNCNVSRNNNTCRCSIANLNSWIHVCSCSLFYTVLVTRIGACRLGIWATRLRPHVSNVCCKCALRFFLRLQLPEASCMCPQRIPAVGDTNLQNTTMHHGRTCCRSMRPVLAIQRNRSWITCQLQSRPSHVNINA